MVLVEEERLHPESILAQVRREQKTTLSEMRATGLRRLLFVAKTTSALVRSLRQRSGRMIFGFAS